MELFTEPSNTYKTREGAVKKLEKVLGERMSTLRWLIGVTQEGRFYPIVCPVGDDKICAIAYAHHGLCVIG